MPERGNQSPRFLRGAGRGLREVAGRQILPIDVARVLRPAAEFVILRHPRHVHMLHVRIEVHADAELVDRIAASIGVPVNVEWLAVGALSRAAYKAQRVLDVRAD